MLEIYNEQVRDLLTQDNPKGGLPVSFFKTYFHNVIIFFTKLKEYKSMGTIKIIRTFIS